MVNIHSRKLEVANAFSLQVRNPPQVKEDNRKLVVFVLNKSVARVKSNCNLTVFLGGAMAKVSEEVKTL